MSAKEKEDFVIADKRKFTSEGDLRSQDAAEEIEPEVNLQEDTQNSPEVIQDERPSPPSMAEQVAQNADYHAAGKKIDSMMQEAGAERPMDMEITFERLIASLYMQTMAQLGMLREDDTPPRPDIIGARQTIDTLALLEAKTKGNLTSQESGTLQNCIFELRMAFLEITNLLTKAPTPGAEV